MEVSQHSAHNHLVGLAGAHALEVKESDDGRLVFEQGAKALVIPAFFAVVGLLILLWYYGALGDFISGVQRIIVIPIIGAAVFIPSLLIVIRWRARMMFDRAARVFKSSVRRPLGFSFSFRNNEVNFDDIAGVQLLYSSAEGGCACSGHQGAYEVNLVLKNPEGKRVGLLMHEKKQTASGLAEKIAQFIGVDLINHTQESCHV